MSELGETILIIKGLVDYADTVFKEGNEKDAKLILKNINKRIQGFEGKEEIVVSGKPLSSSDVKDSINQLQYFLQPDAEEETDRTVIPMMDKPVMGKLDYSDQNDSKAPEVHVPVYERLTLEKVAEITQTADATIYKWMRFRGFPKQMFPGCRNAFWIKSEVEEWISKNGRLRRERNG